MLILVKNICFSIFLEIQLIQSGDAARVSYIRSAGVQINSTLYQGTSGLEKKRDHVTITPAVCWRAANTQGNAVSGVAFQNSMQVTPSVTL